LRTYEHGRHAPASASPGPRRLDGLDRGHRRLVGHRLPAGADVGLDDAWIGLHDRRRTLDQDLAAYQARDPIAQREDEPHVVLDDDDRQPTLPDLDDQFLDRARLLRVHPGRGLVEQQHRGLGGERPCDLEPALVPIGHRAGQVVGRPGQPDLGQQVEGDLAGLTLLAAVAGAAPDRRQRLGLRAAVPADHHVLQRGHVAEESDVLEGAGDPGLDHRHRLGRQHDPVEDHLALGRLVHDR